MKLLSSRIWRKISLFEPYGRNTGFFYEEKAIHRQKDNEIYDILRGSEGYFDWLDHHYQVEETELQSCNTPQGYMLTLVDVTKILEQNHRMKELVTQAEAATQAKSAFVSIYPMRSVPL